jgi:hypothetical protein
MCGDRQLQQSRIAPFLASLSGPDRQNQFRCKGFAFFRSPKVGDGLRGVAKEALLVLGGRHALDRVKLLLRAVSQEWNSVVN